MILGTLSSMPAVNTFAMYASLSILINFILQITAFISLLSLDSRRSEVTWMSNIKRKKKKKEGKKVLSLTRPILEIFTIKN